MTKPVRVLRAQSGRCPLCAHPVRGHIHTGCTHQTVTGVNQQGWIWSKCECEATPQSFDQIVCKRCGEVPEACDCGEGVSK
jgi:hypothetical protein